MKPLYLLFCIALLSGCSKKESSETISSEAAANDSASTKKDFVYVDESTTPEEKHFLEAGKPFVVALANRQYPQAYEMLSSHAKARMSLNQFDVSEDEAQLKANYDNPLQNVTADQFAEQIKRVEGRFGPPHEVERLSVQSVDPKTLAGQATEPMDKLDIMFAIGMMPESIPADIRRASLRAQIKTEWKPEDLQRAAKDMGTTEEEARKNLDAPYFNLKFVLVEESGQLKVGYFEFMPPSMLD
jgi:hypothetical protein